MIHCYVFYSYSFTQKYFNFKTNLLEISDISTNTYENSGSKFLKTITIIVLLGSDVSVKLTVIIFHTNHRSLISSKFMFSAEEDEQL